MKSVAAPLLLVILLVLGGCQDESHSPAASPAPVLGTQPREAPAVVAHPTATPASRNSAAAIPSPIPSPGQEVLSVRRQPAPGTVSSPDPNSAPTSPTAAEQQITELSFTRDIYEFIIAEDLEIGAIAGVLSTSATPAEGITYYVLQGNEEDHFKINPETGQIIVAYFLDYETIDSYLLTIGAGPEAEVLATTTVAIKVTDVREAQIQVDDQMALLDQTVTLTASTDYMGDSPVSYQWSRWAPPVWVDENIADQVRVISASSEGLRTYRVIATVEGFAPLISRPVGVLWMPLAIRVDASPEMPGESDVVTLRTFTYIPDGYETRGPVQPPLHSSGAIPLSTTVPDDIAQSYRWQERVGDSWIDMLATSTVIRVRSNDRDVREFRLLVDYGSTEPSESSPVVVVWNELWLYGQISEAVRLTVEASSEYMTAEADLLNCVNPFRSRLGLDPYSSFDAILNDYNRATSDLVEECDGRKGNAGMFETVERLSATELNRLADEIPSYAALLRTPRGMDFARTLASSVMTKLTAGLQATSR